MKSTNKSEPYTAPLDFYFWLGEEGHIQSVTPEELEQKQKDWDGQRP